MTTDSQYTDQLRRLERLKTSVMRSELDLSFAKVVPVMEGLGLLNEQIKPNQNDRNSN